MVLSELWPNYRSGKVIDWPWLSSAAILCLIVLYVVLLPTTRVLPALGTYDEKRVLECILIVLICTVIAGTPALCRAWLQLFYSFSHSSRVVLGGCVMLGFISSLFAVSVRFAILELVLFVSLFNTALSLSVVRRQSGLLFDRMIVLSVFTVGWIYLAILGASFVNALTGSVSFEREALFCSFSNIRFFGQFQTWTLPLMVLPWFFLARYPLLRLITVLIGASWWFLLFVSGTRGTAVAMLAAGVLVAVVFGRRASPWFKLQALILMLGLLTYILIFFVLPSLNIYVLSSSVMDNSITGRNLFHSSGRMSLWILALGITTQYPLLGVGPMHFACESNLIASHPHNVLLQLTSEWGLPVAIGAIFLFFKALFPWIRRANVTIGRSEDKWKRLLYPALLASLCGAAVHGLVSGLIVMPMSQVMLVLIAGWMLSLYQHDMKAPLPQPCNVCKNSKICILILLPVFLFAGLTVLSWPGSQDRQRFLHSPFADVHRMPRFWQQGKICIKTPDVLEPQIDGKRQE